MALCAARLRCGTGAEPHVSSVVLAACHAEQAAGRWLVEARQSTVCGRQPEIPVRCLKPRSAFLIQYAVPITQSLWPLSQAVATETGFSNPSRSWRLRHLQSQLGRRLVAATGKPAVLNTEY